MTTAMYHVWVHFDDTEEDKIHDAVRDAMYKIPGFIDYSWEDSYDDD